jgi:hypothetical protein
MRSYATDVRGIPPFVRWTVTIYNPSPGIAREQVTGRTLTRRAAWDAADRQVAELMAEGEPPLHQSGWSASDYHGWWQLVEPDPDLKGWKVNGPWPRLDPLRAPPEGWPDPPEDAA